WIFHFSLQGATAIAQIPQPAGWGSFTSAYKERLRSPKSPNRQVGDLSLQPTRSDCDRPNPPTGRLGILHFSLQGATAIAQIPQPGVWGSFTSAYKERLRSPKSPNREFGDLSLQPTRSDCDRPNPPTGRLGIFHFSLQGATAIAQITQPAGWGSFTSAYKERLRSPKSPNREVGDPSLQPTRSDCD